MPSTYRPNKYVQEITPNRRKKFYLGIGLYVLGFIVLITIGSAINDNGYLLRGFLAPFFTLLGIIFIPYSLYHK